MSESKTSQSQQKTAPEMPFQNVFGSEGLTGALEKMSALHAEWGKQVETGMAHVHTAIDESARLAKESLNYGTKFSSALSNAALESLRASTEWLRAKR